MKILPYIIGIALLIVGFVFTSCHKDLDTGDDLSKHDKEFIKTLGLLDSEEKIILFDSQGAGFNGLMTSGNFITEKRIASYGLTTETQLRTVLTMHFTPTLIRYGGIQSLNL